MAWSTTRSWKSSTAATSSAERRRRLAGALLLTFAGAGVAAGLARWNTPATAATALRPSIYSHGSPLDAELFAVAEGPPRPLVIFLHGYPGGDRNVDLARAVHAAGYQTLLFSPRGMKPSAGEFSFTRSLEDVDAVLTWARAPEVAARYRLDPAHIALVGHSFGGWQALITAGHERPEVCVAALAAWNVGWVGRRFAAHPDERAANLEDFRVDDAALGGTVSAAPEALVSEMAAHSSAWDYLDLAATLAAHPLLLIAATRDTPDEDVAMHAALAAGVRAAGGSGMRTLTLADDHPFGAHRKQLAETLIDWLDQDCIAKRPPASAAAR